MSYGLPHTYSVCVWERLTTLRGGSWRDLYTSLSPSLPQACAVLGLLVVPLAYLTVWELVHSITAAFLTGVILVCGKWWLGWGKGGYWVKGRFRGVARGVA